MNKAELIERIAAEAGINNKEAHAAIEALEKIVIAELKAGNEVRISGFGVFSSKKRHARGGVNPQKPSERISIPEVLVAKFKAGKTLKDALKK